MNEWELDQLRNAIDRLDEEAELSTVALAKRAASKKSQCSSVRPPESLDDVDANFVRVRSVG